MGRVPCCEKDNVKRGQWTPEEDNKLSSYIAQHGTRNWRLIPKNAGLQRCGKSCRLRWTNYLRPDLKHDQFTEAEEQSIVKLHSVVGNRWSLIAAQLPGRTDNDVKNYWNTKLKKKLSGMGIDPVTHKPFSHLMAEIATALAPPQVTHLAEAALGCFKDEMLHVLTKKRPDQHPHLRPPHNHNHNLDNHEAAEKIKLGLSRAISDDVTMIPNKPPCNINWGDQATPFDHFDAAAFGFRFAQPYDALPWDQTLYTTNTTSGTAAGTGTTSSYLKLEPNKHPQTQNEHGSASASASSALFGSECVLWDLPSDDLMDA